MNIIILAAGKNIRIKKILKKIPKTMVLIHKKPILQHHIENCVRYSFKKIFINTHYKKEIINNYFKSGKNFKCSITYSYEKKLLGTSGAIFQLRNQIKSNFFCVIYGDNFFKINLAKMLEYHKSKKSDFTIATVSKIPTKSGVLNFNKNKKIIKFEEKGKYIKQKKYNVNAGVYIINKKLLKFFKSGYSDFAYDLIPELIKSGKNLYSYNVRNKLVAIDTINLFKKLSKN